MPRLSARIRQVVLVGIAGALLFTHASNLRSQQGLSIGSYQLVSQQVQKNTTLFTYRATLINTAGPLIRATATAMITNGPIKLVDNALSFGRVAAGASIVSSDTFSFTYNKDNPDFSKIAWTITPVADRPPVANAGPDFSRPIGQVAQLDGSTSTDPDGDPLTYAWSFVSRPAGSTAVLSNPTSPTPTFLVDRKGSFVVQLIVSDGFLNSAADLITVSGPNTIPVANAGPDQTLAVGSVATLDGGASSDANGDPLTYAWSIQSAPAVGQATLSNATTIHPSFTIDAAGTYIVSLIVNDGTANSTADTVTITTLNSAPVANAGPDQTARVTQVVTLDGSGSSDIDGDTLAFAWTLINRPAGSNAALSNATGIRPTFTVDRPGTYTAALIVSDGQLSSAQDTVIINTQNSAPVANAGPDQTSVVTSTVILNGSGSTDVDGDVITYAWSLVSVPPGSAATLSDPTAVAPTFVIDRPGSYVAQLIVSDGLTTSAPDSISITTLNSPPVASAGNDQTVVAGQTVVLDGVASSDVDGDPLSYRWSFTNIPLNSTASLTNSTSRVASFVADRPGTYVIQLIVNDGTADSVPDTVAVTTTNSIPVAIAGPDQSNLPAGQLVTLDGTQSSDADGQPLTYSWSLIARPAASLATLTGATTSAPAFTPDAAGDYVAQLIVNDGFADSQPDTVLIQVVAPLPIANAGPDQQVMAGATAQLDGSGSSGTLLSYFWQLTSTPAGSGAILQNPTTLSPSFVADVAGDFVIQLTVTDGVAAIATDSVTVTALSPQSLPQVTLNPSDLTVAAGQAATFSAAATGSPSPTVQWQRSTDGGATYSDFAGATSETLTFITVPTDDGNRFRAVFSNAAGTSMTSAATLSVTIATDSEPITITDAVTINGAPMLGPVFDQTVDAGTPVTFTATVIDPGDADIFTLVNAPAGAAIDPLTGIFNWTPSEAQSGSSYTLAVNVTDSGGLTATRTLTITVRPVIHELAEPITVTDSVSINGAPMLDPIADQTVTAGTPATFTAVVTDPGDTHVFTLVNAPPGASIDPQFGAFSWTPTAAQSPGVYSFVVRVTDSGGLFAERPITITTLAAQSLPIVTVTPTDNSAAEGTSGDTGTFTVTRVGGDVTSPLAVQLAVGGSATSGVDFGFSANFAGTTVVIPPGHLTADITVTPIDDTIAEGSETVVVGLTTGAAYTIGSPAVATMIIGDDDLVVTNINDSGVGSLRQAILDANSRTGVTDTIRFDIPGAGLHTIAPNSPLPVITDAVTIDGSTQPDYLAYQSMIELDGSNAGPNANGLVVVVGSTTFGPTMIKGLVINRFGTGGTGPGGFGLQLAGPAAATIVIEENVIGADATGVTARPNRSDAISVDSAFVVIRGNVIAFNGGAGITLAGTPGDMVLGNTISTNGGAGVRVVSGTGHTIFFNSIFSNTGLAIDLADDGLTPNDIDDADTGPNDLQNFPVLTSVLSSNGTATVEGSLTSTPNSAFQIHFYYGPSCDSSGHGLGPGQFQIAGISVPTDALGSATFAVTIPLPLQAGAFVTATATGAGGTSEFSACHYVNASVTLTPSPLNLQTSDGGSFDVGLRYPAGPGGVLVTLTSSDNSIASPSPSTVFFDQGSVDELVNIVTGTNAGTATITATASLFDSGTAQVNVTLRGMSLSSASPFVGIGRTIGGKVTLDQPAPFGGVTVTLASSDPSVTVSPSLVTIAAGSQTAPFTLSGVSVGTATVSATASGFATATLPISATATTLITLGSGIVAPGLDTSLALSIGIRAPAGGVTISFASSNPSIVSVVTPTVFIPEGLQIPAANPVVHGGAIGTAQITASAVGFAPDTAQVSVTLSISFSPNVLTLAQGQTSTVTLHTSDPAPAGGLTFNTSTDNTAVATVPSTVHIETGTTSIQVPVTGVAVGSTIVRASAPGITAAAATVNVTPAPPITIGDATIGQDLQVSLSGTLGAPAPAGNEQVTITSLDPTRMLLSADPTTAGVASLTLQVGAGLTTIPTFYVQALAGTGTVTLQTSAPDYTTDTSTITLTPSGFSFPIGTSSTLTTTSFSSNTSLGIVAQRLNPDLTVAGSQELRGGLSVNVPIASSNTLVGTIVDSANDQLLIDHVTLTGGDSFVTAEFDPKEGGATSIALTAPLGYSTPTQLQQIAVTVSAPPINVGDTTVGQDLEAALSGSLGAPAPAGNEQVTITSLDPARLLLSTDATSVGVASLTLQVGAGQTTFSFYVQALAGSGTVTLRTSAPGYSTDTSTITLTPSGFSFAIGTNPTLTTTSFSSNTSLGVIAARLNADLTVAGAQALRGGLEVNVPISSSNALVGTIVDSVNDQLLIDHVTLTGGDSFVSAEFDPKEGGTTTIALTTPAGYSTPTQLQQIVVTVSAPPINVGNTTVGQDLQAVLAGSLGAPAPAGNEQVTITSLDPARMLLSVDGTTAGSASVTLEVGAGQTTIPNFYVQALAGSGTVTLQTSAPGYTTDTSTITLTPSGFSFPPGTQNISTTTFATNTQLNVQPTRLNPDLSVAGFQELRGGLSPVSVTVANSDPNVGTIVDVNNMAVTSLTFGVGDAQKSFFFNPAAGGTTTISVVTPAGYSTPSTLRQISATVTAPNITFSLSTVQVGLDLQTSVTLNLGASPPSQLIVTATSNSGTIATITTDPAVVGASSATFPDVPATLPGTTVGTLYIQGRSLGTTTITAQAPGYNDATLTVTVTPSGFAYPPGSGNISTTTFSANTTLNVQSMRLDPTTLNVAAAQPLRGGLAPVSVGVTSSNTTVGTIVNSPVVINPGDTFKSVQFDPANAGTSTISVVPPAGFTIPSNLQQITATVTAPNVTFNLGASAQVGLELQVSSQINLGATPPAPVTATATSNDPSIVTITTNPAVTGGSSATFNNVSVTTVGTLYLQGRSLGTTTITVQVPGYNTATLTVTVHPSGFAFPTGTGNLSMNTFSANSTVNVQPMRLDPTTHNVAAAQQLRGGFVGSVSIDVTCSNTTVGTIINSPMVFNATDLTKSVQFDPVNAGTSTISIVPPAGFTTPSNLQQLTATVTAPNIGFSLGANALIGLDLQVLTQINLGATPPAPVTVTATSNNPAVATITTNPALTGVSSLTFNNVSGTVVGTLYVQGRSLGSTTITVQAPGYNDATLNVTVHPSGFSFASGAVTFSTTTFSTNTGLTVQPMRLDPTTHNVAAAQSLRGGFAGPVNVDVTSSNSTVGTIVNSPAVFNPNDSSKTVQFDPANAGTSTISIVQPAGFTTPSNLQQMTATVTAPNITFSLSNVQIGLDLQISTTLSFSVAPPSQRDVTVTSNNSAVATITTNPLIEGATSLTFLNAPASGTTIGTLYIQGRSLGTTTITVHASGYNDATLNVTIHPSGFAFASGTANFSVAAGAANRTIGVQAARLDPTTLAVAANQSLRGGYGTVNLAVTSSNTTVGTIVNSPAVFGANEFSKNVQFDPASAGTSTIRVVQPAGFTTPLNLQQITATVTP